MNAASTGSLLLIAAIFMIATTAIGTECYNKNENLKAEKKHNFNFLVFNLVVAIFLFFSAFSAIYFGIKKSM